MGVQGDGALNEGLSVSESRVARGAARDRAGRERLKAKTEGC
jgi:hypothetical protein